MLLDKSVEKIQLNSLTKKKNEQRHNHSGNGMKWHHSLHKNKMQMCRQCFDFFIGFFINCLDYGILASYFENNNNYEFDKINAD